MSHGVLVRIFKMHHGCAAASDELTDIRTCAGQMSSSATGNNQSEISLNAMVCQLPLQSYACVYRHPRSAMIPLQLFGSCWRKSSEQADGVAIELLKKPGWTLLHVSASAWPN